MSHGYWTYVGFQIVYVVIGVFLTYKALQKLDIIIELLKNK